MSHIDVMAATGKNQQESKAALQETVNKAKQV
jgi:hypothetical protein